MVLDIKFATRGVHIKLSFFLRTHVSLDMILKLASKLISISAFVFGVYALFPIPVYPVT